MTQANGIAVWAEGIKAELARRLPRQRKTQRDKLAVLVATMLHVRSANLVEVAAGLPRASDRWDMGYQPGFARWVDTIPSKRLETLGKTRIPTFTRCQLRFLRFGPPKLMI